MGRLVLVAAINYGERSGDGKVWDSVADSDIVANNVVPCEQCVA